MILLRAFLVRLRGTVRGAGRFDFYKQIGSTPVSGPSPPKGETLPEYPLKLTSPYWEQRPASISSPFGARHHLIQLFHTLIAEFQ